MKIRQGFVSNSSSSSFIIAMEAGLDPIVENFHKTIFGTKTQNMIYVSSYDIGEFDYSQIPFAELKVPFVLHKEYHEELDTTGK